VIIIKRVPFTNGRSGSWSKRGNDEFWKQSQTIKKILADFIEGKWKQVYCKKRGRSKFCGSAKKTVFENIQGRRGQLGGAK